MIRRSLFRSAALVLSLAVAACSTPRPDSPEEVAASEQPDYLIGPGDVLQVFVWRNPELTVTVPVRPDGRISTPLIEDMVATGKTPTRLARDVEDGLRDYVQDPVVTVIVNHFVGPFSQQVRVIGEATRPQAIPFSQNMSVLDVMIAVGGMTPFAAGNRATLVRKVGGKEAQIPVNLEDLINGGDISENRRVLPGDVLVIPQSWF